jgi:hypothetical protein
MFLIQSSQITSNLIQLTLDLIWPVALPQENILVHYKRDI